MHGYKNAYCSGRGLQYSSFRSALYRRRGPGQSTPVPDDHHYPTRIRHPAADHRPGLKLSRLSTHTHHMDISATELDDDELPAHLSGLRAALLTAADEDADDLTLENIARSIKDCRTEMDRRGLR